MARRCKQCGAAILWGAPQCVACGSYTFWRSRLATLGLVIGAGTVLVVVASLARLWLLAPPAQVRAAGEVQEFLQRVADSPQRDLVAGAGRCKPEIADALCVQTTAAFADLSAERRAAARNDLTALWRSVAEAAPKNLLLVDEHGTVEADRD